MGAKCGIAEVSTEVEDVPAYPWQYTSGEQLETATKNLPESPKNLPRLGLQGDGPTSVISKPSLPTVFFHIDEDDVLYPVPAPEGSPRKSRRRSSNAFPISSYAVCDASLRASARHVDFVRSPTHSVHRSEYGVQPYSEVYGTHPREFDFDEFGNKIPREAVSLARPSLPSLLQQSDRYNEFGACQSSWQSDRYIASRSRPRADRYNGSDTYSSDGYMF